MPGECDRRFVGTKSHVMCEACRRKIGELTRAGIRRRQRSGLPVGGRPRKDLDPKVLEEARRGRLTIAQATKRLGVSGPTVRRRLRD